MIHHKIDCWEVYTSYDRDITHVAYFETEALAAQYMSKHKNCNYMNKRKIRQNYMIFEDLVEVEQYSRENIRKNAIAKLSDIELDVLGIKV